MAFSLYSVTGRDVIGREEIIKEIVEEISSQNKIGFSLSGIRRIGKTSIPKGDKETVKRERNHCDILFCMGS